MLMGAEMPYRPGAKLMVSPGLAAAMAAAMLSPGLTAMVAECAAVVRKATAAKTRTSAYVLQDPISDPPCRLGDGR